jgi:hypothetical protein
VTEIVEGEAFGFPAPEVAGWRATGEVGQTSRGPAAPGGQRQAGAKGHQGQRVPSLDRQRAAVG